MAAKVFIQRDYTNGTVCQFQTKFPSELESRVRKLVRNSPRALRVPKPEWREEEGAFRVGLVLCVLCGI